MLSDRTLNDPPWVVEIDGVKFATPEAVVLLLKEVSEERDALEAQNEGYGQLLGSANNDVERLTEYADKLEAQVAALREALELLGGTPKNMLDHCIINELLERPIPKHISLDSYCRRLIAKESLDA